MFAPVYAAAAQRGIAPSVLDESPIHVVGWALSGGADPDAPETVDDMFDAYRERERAIADGRLDDFYVAHDGGMN